MSRLDTLKIYFAEVLSTVGERLHIGCLMAAGHDWVEVSMPEHQKLDGELLVRLLPSTEAHDVTARWRGLDRVGLVFVSGGPPEDHFAGLPGLKELQSASQKERIVGARKFLDLA